MSEWKWCQDCHHHIDNHNDGGFYGNPCVVDGCDCPKAAIDLADLL